MELTINPRLLKPRASVRAAGTGQWRAWEKKSLNIHRGVIEWHVDTPRPMNEIAASVREGVKLDFGPGFLGGLLRGFGFGAILHLRQMPSDFAQICPHIDRRNKSRGVWQWVIVCFDEDQVAIGLHTWMHGYLRPVYDEVLAQCAAAGYLCTSEDAQMDRLNAALQKFSDNRAVKILKLLSLGAHAASL